MKRTGRSFFCGVALEFLAQGAVAHHEQLRFIEALLAQQRHGVHHAAEVIAVPQHPDVGHGNGAQPARQLRRAGSRAVKARQLRADKDAAAARASVIAAQRALHIWVCETATIASALA